jgi:hypothetical protein
LQRFAFQPSGPNGVPLFGSVYGNRPGSIAAVGKQFVMLTESQVFNPAGELGLLVDQAWGGGRPSAGENSGAESYHKNNQYNRHKIFISSSGVNQMENLQFSEVGDGQCFS